MAKQVMFTIAVFAVFVQLASSCCGPAQWEGYEGVFAGVQANGTGGEGKGLLNISVDANINKVAIKGYSMWNGQRVKQHLLNDYSAGNSYTAYNGKCLTAALPPYPSPGKLNCVPYDAKLVLSTYYGAGDNKYEIDVYEFMVDGIKIELSVNKGSCVPVGEHQQLANGFADVGFMGITEGIKDPSVFDIPPECNNARTVSPRMRYIKKTEHV
ncbi:ependymin-related protein 1-like [Mytilus californianus]|uniref:ependymin-related protein 1-like n=1 Tax=Mytilus californianus TaxID=6549 RepID=UPI002246E231|nr:ependymin-related protein 1-like [Mytilus californianus]